jgi:hypothetical protein
LLVLGLSPGPVVKWKESAVLNQDFNSSPAVGDIDGDSILDVVLGTGDGKVYAWRGTDGAVLAGWPVETGAIVRGSAAIADINGDGYPDVLIGDELGVLHGFDYKGEVLPGFPIRTTASIRSAPVVWDVNGDGLVDIFCQAMDKTIYAWTYQGVFNPSRIVTPWPMFLHDPRHTSLFSTEMPFASRLASWDLQWEDGGVNMSWEPLSWDGTGSWRVYRGHGPALPGAMGALPSPGRAVCGRPAFLSSFTDVTELGFLSSDGASVITFRDPAAGVGEISYVLEYVSEDGSSRFFGPRTVKSLGSGAGWGAALLAVAPNPFKAWTEFVLLVPEVGVADPVTLRVFDAAGRAVATFSWKDLAPGAHRLRWEGQDRWGKRLPAGVYFYRIEAGRFSATGKMLRLR